MRRRLRAWLCTLTAAGVVGWGAGCAPPLAEGETCGFGERQGLFGCAPVDHLHVNFDERRQELNGTSRSGIGVNACSFRAVSLVPVASDERCAAYTFSGAYAQESFPGSGGGIVAELAEPVQMVPSGLGEGCYDTDLHPNRSDLFSDGETFEVLSLGGADFPPFDVDLRAPETLALETPTQVARGEDLSLTWTASDADMLAVLLWAFDEEADQSTNIACFFDDAPGAATVSSDLVAELQGGASMVDLYFYRQNWVHLEPDDAEVAVDLVATSSVTRRVPLEP